MQLIGWLLTNCCNCNLYNVFITGYTLTVTVTESFVLRPRGLLGDRGRITKKITSLFPDTTTVVTHILNVRPYSRTRL